MGGGAGRGRGRAGEPAVPHARPFPDRQTLANLPRAEGTEEQDLKVCFWNSIPAPYEREKTPWTPRPLRQVLASPGQPESALTMQALI